MRLDLTIRQRVLMVIALLVGVMGAASALKATRDFQHWSRARRVERIADVSRDSYDALDAFRLERGVIDNQLSGPNPASDRSFASMLDGRGHASLRLALAKTAQLQSANGQSSAREIAARLAALDAMQPAIAQALAQPLDRRPASLDDRWVQTSQALCDAIERNALDLKARVTRDEPSITQLLSVAQVAWGVRSAAGNQMLVQTNDLTAERRLTVRDLVQMNFQFGRIEAGWRLIAQYAEAPGVPDRLRLAVKKAQKEYFEKAQPLDEAVLEAQYAGRPAPVAIGEEHTIDQAGLASLMGVVRTSLDIAKEQAADTAAAAEQQFLFALAVMMLALLTGLSATLFVERSVLAPIGRITSAMETVARGDLDGDIPCEDRRDEVGALARALGVFRDNALAKRRMDEELLSARIARETAEAAARTKAEFLANMSHEIRTPLTSVIGFADLLVKLEGLPDKAQTYLRRITTGGRALLSLVNDILEFSRIEAGQIELEAKGFDLPELLRETVELVGPEAEAKGLRFELAPAADLPQRVVGDAERIRQILLNLISNAIKFTQEGGVSVSASHSGGEHGRLKLTVADTGIGISHTEGERLFERFSQADQSNTRKYGGVGLGLAISKGLVELMGGEIGVEAAPGQGSTFWFAFPAAVVADAPMTRSEAKPSVELQRQQVLVVDDVATNRELIIAMLSAFDVGVDVAGDGAEAVEIATRKAFDVILMDLQMPVMDGLDAARAIRAGTGPNRHAPIIAVSANVMPAHVAAAIAAGMDDHVGKPIDPVELLTKVAHWGAQARVPA